jgi:2-oxoglutarate ferredoxin oxidoreductase subunit delta
MKFCQKKLIHKGTKLNKFSYYPPEVAEGCTACGICATVCPDAAITVYKEV